MQAQAPLHWLSMPGANHHPFVVYVTVTPVDAPGAWWVRSLGWGGSSGGHVGAGRACAPLWSSGFSSSLVQVVGRMQFLGAVVLRSHFLAGCWMGLPSTLETARASLQRGRHAVHPGDCPCVLATRPPWTAHSGVFLSSRPAGCVSLTSVSNL